MFKGSCVALVTPMQTDGTVDIKSFLDLIEWHIAEKTKGLIIAGTTGEGSTLTEKEQYDLISFAVKHAAKRIPIIAGTGSNCTHHTITLTQNAKKAGADAALIVTPYYNKPTQQGLYLHYKAVADHVDLPILLYNVPGRTACDLLPETIEHIAKLPRIIGIKEATGKVERVTDIQERCGKEFILLSGDDATSLPFMTAGGHGVISVTANVAPRKMSDMCEAALTGKNTLAQKINKDLMLLHQHLFLEANPIPVKWALQQMGKIPLGIRLPLTELSEQHHEAVKKAIEAAGITLDHSCLFH